MKYLFWRGKSLYCRYPLPGYPEKFPLAIYTTGSKTDINRSERLGEQRLAELRVIAANSTLFDTMKVKEEPKQYNPKFWRLVARYWWFHLRFQKSGQTEKYHLIHCLRKFGKRYASEIYREDIELWRNEMRNAGTSINAINNRYSYMRASYTYANGENNPLTRFDYNPMRSMKALEGANIRTFVLTKEKFERNYEYFLNKYPRFALFYLALWETGRRPQETSQYTWEMIREIDIKGTKVHIISVPPMIAKTSEPDTLPISNRLWAEISQLAYRHGLIFRNLNGERWRQWSCHQANLEKNFGKDGGWIRDCRRGMITHKCEVEGHDPKHVQAVSGHRSDSVFNRYRIGSLENVLNVVNPRPNHAQFEAFA